MSAISVRRIIYDPLVHFLILGAALFALYGAVSPDKAAEDAGRTGIEITADDLRLMRDDWQKQFRRLPTSSELDRLVAERIREEVLYREALQMGLDQGDPAIRRQMAEKVLFMLQDLAAVEQPSDAQLSAFMAANADQYKIPESASFRHVFFDMSRRADAMADARSALATLTNGGAIPVGDNFELGDEFNDLDRPDLARLLGKSFASAVMNTSRDGWIGPVESDYGVHLLQVSEYRPARTAELAEVRDKVTADYLDSQRETAADRYYQEALQRYSVDVAERTALRVASE